MDESEWQLRWVDRTQRYAGRHLDPSRAVTITAEPTYIHTIPGQVALLTATSLISRMTTSAVLDVPDVGILPGLPWAGQSLRQVALAAMNAQHPYARYLVRDLEPQDYRFHLGPSGAPHLVHGVGWNAYVGPGPSTLPNPGDANGIGAALAVILGAAHLFREPFGVFALPYVCNALTWQETSTTEKLTGDIDVGDLFTIGLGSVGSAAMYFLALATRRMRPTLIDMDPTKIENITRSPIFSAADAENEDLKVDVVAVFLRSAGVADVKVDPVPLHQSDLWMRRPAGSPDIVIAAANEHDARFHVEMSYPPMQVYATTGRNWQATLFRHVPGGPCSLCAFPPETQKVATRCATDEDAPVAEERPVDAALPFLSFGAGLMTAAEVLKLAAGIVPAAIPKVTLQTRPSVNLLSTPLLRRAGCSCVTRDATVHAKMVAGSRFRAISRFA